MSRIFTSPPSLGLLAAIEQRPGGLALADLARAVAIPLSTAQAAVRSLAADRLVEADAPSRPRYRLAAGRGEAVGRLLAAGLALGEEGILEAGMRACPAVGFAGRDAEGLLVVTRWDAEPADLARLETLLGRLDPQVAVRQLDHDDVRDALLDDPGLHDRAGRVAPITGSVDRFFPDPRAHGSGDSPFLGRLHPALRHPSRAAVERVARDFRLAEVRVFGSAVHEDFRPDSDVDVLVRRRPGGRRTLVTEMRLRRALEDLFDRDIDLVDANVVSDRLARRAAQESVALYG